MTIAPFAEAEGGIRLNVRVTPRAKRSACSGIVETKQGASAAAIRLAAPPVEGAANQAPVAFLAEALGLPRSAVRLAAGAKSRLKVVELGGVSAEAVSAWLAGCAP